ncbi:hypothetical protein SMB34_03860 [Thalassospira permensis NBRC 106175]|uniref:Uncharacterized protein n=1 Tax=Thalassospira permensis NBRC 106175 TaxID=1353532 RepID=A0ABR4TRS8_9PROT|nr:hypothetical protein SMB34_03860 [Thalassospira permensis NBRC 106175]
MYKNKTNNSAYTAQLFGSQGIYTDEVINHLF